MEILATLFAIRLRARLPLLERLVGIARPRTTLEPNGEQPVRVTVPLPVTFTAAACAADPRYLVPDGSTAGVAFFEDAGTITYSPAIGVNAYETTLRLLVWLNADGALGALSELQLLGAVTRAVRPRQRFASGALLDVFPLLTPLAANAESLFARYSFADSELLYPPHRVAGYELKVKWRPAPDCLPPAV